MSVSPTEKRRFFDQLAGRWDLIKPAEASAPGVERGLALVEPLAGRSIVDVGCGTGLVEGHLLSRIGRGRIIAIDFSAEMIALAQSRHPSDRITWLCRDMLDTGLCDLSVDVVLCFNTFPHFPDPAAAVREMTRWVRSRGQLLVWHDAGREEIAAAHSEAAPPIVDDRLPPVEQLAGLVVASGLEIVRAEEDAASYTLLARRPVPA
jgi:demethylmenaquinone methyltransferase/2-methoxy-6-polyprenyl-1,4-benzoquinol methylase